LIFDLMFISATIVTLNEERNLPRALESLTCVDEIVVVDSGSTDRTVEIARTYGARLIQQEWLGYAGQKNFAAAAAANNWILAIDADEALSELLQAEIMALRETNPDVPGFRFPRRAQYLGGWIKHSGWYPDAKVRLYDRRRGRWTGDYVHESVRVDGAPGDLTGDLHHFTCASLEEHRRTMERYTTLAAQELRAQGKRSSAARLLLSPSATFLKTYVLQQGYRDGYRGYLIAKMAAKYVYLKHRKTRQG
jgi:glycosyltransferase involved in cell wall biosynthesis